MHYFVGLLRDCSMEFGNFNMIFFYDLGVHFDIWNNLGKKFFFKNFKNRRGDHMNFCTFCIKIVMVPPTILKIFEKKFFHRLFQISKWAEKLLIKNTFKNF